MSAADWRDVAAAFWWGLGAGLVAAVLRSVLRRL
jgi:hypothetical protein